jgi:hypothetical protein
MGLMIIPMDHDEYPAWYTYKKRTGSHGPVEIVDLPINSMVIFHSYVSLPEGN